MPRTIALFVGILIAISPNFAKSQGVRRRSRLVPQPAKSIRSQQLVPTFARDGEKRIMGAIQAMEHQMEQVGAMLQQQLSKAHQVRQRGLSTNNKKLLAQAEHIERQALARYDQWVKYMDRFSIRLNKSTKAQAELQAGSSTPSDTKAKRKPQTSAKRRSNRSRRGGDTRWLRYSQRRNKSDGLPPEGT